MTEVLVKRLFSEKSQKKLTDGFHNVFANYVISSNDQIVFICFCCDDHNTDLCERFMTFLGLEQLTGDHIAKTTLDSYVRFLRRDRDKPKTKLRLVL